eukprot:173252-Alexandrium_andersonii.AAC.1
MQAGGFKPTRRPELQIGPEAEKWWDGASREGPRAPARQMQSPALCAPVDFVAKPAGQGSHRTAPSAA